VILGRGNCKVSETLLGIRLKRQTLRNTDTFETILRHDIHTCFTKERQLIQNLLFLGVGGGGGWVEGETFIRTHSNFP